MDKLLVGFIQEQFPDFVSADHPKFKLFIEAYYEWLEQQNTGTSTSVLNLFKELPNTGAIVANADTIRDVDLTFDGFLEYFRREVIPFTIENTAVSKRFFIKKIRDLYLSKGTPKSFELLFRLVYDEDIEILQTKENILKPSDGQTLEFPQVFAQVVDSDSNLNQLNFFLSEILDDNGNLVNTVLSGSVIDRDSVTNMPVLRLMISGDFEESASGFYTLVDSKDRNIFVRFYLLQSLDELTPVTQTWGYSVGDSVKVESASFSKQFFPTVSKTTTGPVEKLFIRNRGIYFSPGDRLTFFTDSGKGGFGGIASITDASPAGAIKSIDGNLLRNGINNTGYEFNTFQGGFVDVSNGGSWSVLPKVKINSSGAVFGNFGDRRSGKSLNATAYSNKIGGIEEVSFDSLPYFKDSNDVVISTPTKVLVQNLDGLEIGNTVTVQRFTPDLVAFQDDLDTIKVTYTLTKNGDSWGTNDYFIPVGYDYDTFAWRVVKAEIDSDNGIDDVVTRFLASAPDSDVTLVFTQVSPTQQKFEVTVVGSTKNKLDGFHFEQLKNINAGTGIIGSLDWNVDLGNEGNVTDAGSWQNTAITGKITAINEEQSFIDLDTSFNDSDFKTFVKSVQNEYKGVLRLTNTPNDTEGNVEFSNIVVDVTKPKFTYTLKKVINTGKVFVSERGFLNSPSGGVIADEYFYSDFTYLVRTMVPFVKWRQVVLDLLHPAGTQIFGTLVVPSFADATVESFGEAAVHQGVLTRMTFDTSLEHRDEENFSSGAFIDLYADTVNFRANNYEFDNEIIRADFFIENNTDRINYENGDSWWDFEPLGFVDGSRTTQDSDGNGFVKSETKFYSKYDGSVDDRYKTYERFKIENTPMLVETKLPSYLNYGLITPVSFVDFSYYNEKDSGTTLPKDFERIDYRNATSLTPQGLVKTTFVERKKEIRTRYERDINNCMKDESGYVFRDQGNTYTGFDALSIKWNSINTSRTINLGWSGITTNSEMQNISVDGRKRTEAARKSNTKFPVKSTDYDGVWVTNFSTYPLEQDIVSNFEVEEPALQLETPAVKMAGRKK